jgi:hypothetical protein
MGKVVILGNLNDDFPNKDTRKPNVYYSELL